MFFTIPPAVLPYHGNVDYLTPPFIIAILIALSVHEWAHGYVARLLGDPTAEMEGRLTINPLAHIDPLGAMMFLVAGIGWGKPVPVNPRYFRNVKRDMMLTALAGPMSNLLLVFLTVLLAKGISLLPLAVPSGVGRFVGEFITSMLFLNLGLMAFNLLPLAPLDGSKVIGIFISYRHEDAYERFLAASPYILLTLLLAERAFHFPFIMGWISLITKPILLLIEKIL